MRMLIILALVALVIAALIMLLRSGGPRVTTIEHKRDEHDREEGE